MKRTLAALVSLALLVSGCGVGRFESVDLTDKEAPPDQVNRHLKRRNATLVLRDGTVLPVRHVSLGPECTDVVLRRPASRDTVLATWRIDRIEVTSRARGAIVGGLTGLVTGAVLGALLGAGSYSEEDPHIIVTSAGDAAALGGFFLGVIGLGTGVVIGGLAGSQDTYDVWGAAYSDSCGKHSN